MSHPIPGMDYDAQDEDAYTTREKRAKLLSNDELIDLLGTHTGITTKLFKHD